MINLNQSDVYSYLRSVRSYNELVHVLNSINVSVSTIIKYSETVLRKGKPTTLDSSSVQKIQKLHKNLVKLEGLNSELQFAKTFDNTVIKESKQVKYEKLCGSIQTNINNATTSIYRSLRKLTENSLPDNLSELIDVAFNYLKNRLTYTSTNMFTTIPEKDTLDSYIVFNNVLGAGSYVVPNFIIKIHTVNNLDDTESTYVSFPKNILRDVDYYSISNTNKLIDTLNLHIEKLLDISKLSKLRSASKQKVVSLTGVHEVNFNKGVLSITLESGIIGRNINNIITKVLYVISESNPDEDIDSIVYRVTSKLDGSKVINFTLTNYNFSNKRPLDVLGKLLQIKPKMVKEIKKGL